MGLTIHYGGGKAASREKIKECLDALEEVAKVSKWEHWRSADKKHDYMTGNEIENYEEVGMNIDPGCESFVVGFNKDTLACVHHFCKTQYSDDFIGTHHKICKLLELIKTTWVNDLEVHDEGNYYGHWDKEELSKEVQKWHAMIMSVTTQLQKAGFTVDQMGGAAVEWLKK